MRAEQRTEAVFLAEDGTEFSSEEACCQHESVDAHVTTMLTRKEAWAFAMQQIWDSGEGFPGKACHHYGKCEIQELLDHIYGFNSKGEST